ncbi:M1 family metallopeptidase [Flavobacterium macrobrachii]|uniref:M1 family metallopeptidase n=1 Tax=Flavobacterium macrobrachii TaxID=591204 RepID=A0ABS2CZF7_9FLAO|nr:M1 family metallopeptidase [Flavobacterium macrobrachii]MBM6500325.1 M1 family metallopeptidase [Flavobacterium macrobrachii]
MKKIVCFFLIVFGLQSLVAQETFTRKDSLHGGLRFERTCFDVMRYNLDIIVLPRTKKIKGNNEIVFKVVENTKKIQIDLFDNMQIDSIIWNKQKLDYKREFNAVFISFPSELNKETTQSIQFFYQGNPVVARNAPWDGGFVFTKDKNGKDWIGVSVQGTGASLWYPVKDTQTDEPENGASIKVAVPNGLMNVSNGRFMGSEKLENDFTRWDWEVKNPINTYNITLNIGDYVHIHDNHNGLDLDYYVLSYNEEKARKHFEEVKPMMDCFQSKFGNYPFKEDGYKLVETPYLGMEHQSAVAYGNKFLKGYLGNDLSRTGIGLTFDYITIHESGHEWFGNSITSKDIADMWIHEGFTQYTEIVFVECQLGYEKAMQYAKGLQKNVFNSSPIIGNYGVNNEGSGDMYPKGALLLNTLRHVINDDTKWWKLILDYSTTFRHKIIDTETVIAFFNKESGMDLTTVFNQYLRQTSIPKLEYKIENKRLFYKWTTDETNFFMPINIKINGKSKRIYPVNSWVKSNFKVKPTDKIEVSDNFFVKKSFENN